MIYHTNHDDEVDNKAIDLLIAREKRLDEVYQEQYDEEKQLILFIHGFGGNAKKTWGEFPVLIANDDELSVKYDIHMHSFYSPLATVPLLGRKVPKIQDLSDGLHSILDRYKKHNKIVLVCHSLGGLIGRQYLVNLYKNSVSSKVKKIILFASPNNGEDLAKLSKLYFWHRQVRQICKNSDFINTLNDDWGNVRDSVETYCIVGDMDKVVDIREAKSLSGYDNTRVITGKNHTSLVKPHNSDDLSFIFLKSIL